MDEVEEFLRARWRALGEAGALFTRPWTGLDVGSARNRVDPGGRLGDLAGKRVLCLAGGGGQQSVAFALLGARVTVVDLDEDQLSRDRAAAERRGLAVETAQADMRDLSALAGAAFDVVYQPYSINFVPDLRGVIKAVDGVLGAGGVYVLALANPFASGVGTRDWNGEGYVLRLPYVDGAPYAFEDETWVSDGDPAVPPPREYRHTLSTVTDALREAGLFLFGLDEHGAPPGAEPGTWEHLKSVLPPWFTLWSCRQPRGTRAEIAP